MTDKKLSTLFTDNPVDPGPGDLGYIVKKSNGTSGAFQFGQLMQNRYRIVPSVASNDLTSAIKHLDGTTDPSTDYPLFFKVGNTIRKLSAALSVVKVDGTSWGSLGSAEMGTLEHELFQYVVWNTALSTPAVDTFWSRIPFGRVFSDFSTTSTASRYAAQTAGATNPNSTDECVCIGKFAATLSLTGTGHLWTVPTFTNYNLINEPVNMSGWRQWTPTFTGFSADPTSLVFRYRIRADGMCELRMRMGANGTSSATTFTISLPSFTAQTLTNGSWALMCGAVTDNGTASATPGFVTIASAGTTATVNRDALGTAWTNANGKRISHAIGEFPIANF